MKKPKIDISAPLEPRKPVEPVKEYLHRGMIESTYIDFDSTISIETIIKNLKITDLKTEIKFSKYDGGDYYSSEIYGFTIEIWGEKLIQNQNYDSDMKKYEKSLLAYDIKMKEYHLKKEAYDKEYVLYLDKLEEYNLWYHQDQLDRLKKKRKN